MKNLCKLRNVHNNLLFRTILGHIKWGIVSKIIYNFMVYFRKIYLDLIIGIKNHFNNVSVILQLPFSKPSSIYSNKLYLLLNSQNLGNCQEIFYILRIYITYTEYFTTYPTNFKHICTVTKVNLSKKNRNKGPTEIKL